jgi:hypothetical protein
MNPFAVRVALRPRSVHEVLDLAAVMLRVHGPALLRLSIVVLVPVQLALEALSLLDEEPWLGMAVGWMLLPFVQLPFLLFGARALFETTVTLRQVARDLWERRVELLGLSAVTALAVGLTSCSFLVFSFVMLPLIYLPQTVLLERRGVAAGLSRAMNLLGSHFVSTMFGAAVVTVATLWAAVVGEGTGQAMVGFVLQLGEPFGSLWLGDRTPYLLSGTLLIQPLLALFQLLLYLNARTVTEGWDVYLALRAAAEER